MAVSQYSRSVLWLGKGLLGESRYKICIVTEAAGWLGARLSVQGAQATWACGLAGGRQTLGTGRARVLGERA